jgi:hypothetical protein
MTQKTMNEQKKSKFVILDGKKKYQDSWLNMRNATKENFEIDLHILLKEQEKLDHDYEIIQENKNRIRKLIQILSDEEEIKK